MLKVILDSNMNPHRQRIPIKIITLVSRKVNFTFLFLCSLKIFSKNCIRQYSHGSTVENMT